MLPWRCSDRGTVRPRARRGTQEGGAKGASDDCNADRRRGEACTDKCRCQGAFRCGAPRLEDQRAECGQNQDPDPDQEVCCLGQGDSCKNNNDCECCGTLSCHHGRCRVREGTNCALERSITSGRASATGFVDRAQRIIPVRSRRWGRRISARTPEQYARPQPKGDSCVSGRSSNDTDFFRPCTQSADCPANQVCIPFFSGPAPLGLFSGVWPVILMAGSERATRLPPQSPGDRPSQQHRCAHGRRGSPQRRRRSPLTPTTSGRACDRS